ncbi:MAG TPA: redoxin family protein [Aggregatilineales bacterium]|nr:redoxin family protein [Aggregatilineales bacterium]
MKIPRFASLLLLGVFLMSACSSSAAPTPTPAATLEAFMSLPFTDIATNKQVTLADFAGKTVVVEAMAAWCTNCLAQQGQARIALQKPELSSIVYLSLDVDPSEDVAKLVQYEKDHSFPWRFGVSSKALTQALAARFGSQITYVSGIPIFIIGAGGKVSTLYSGGHPADDLAKLILSNA